MGRVKLKLKYDKARLMGLEPTIFSVTGRRDNQLRYSPSLEVFYYNITKNMNWPE